MAIQPISNSFTTQQAYASSSQDEAVKKGAEGRQDVNDAKEQQSASKYVDSYVKNSSSADRATKKSNAAVVEMLKADAQRRTEQMRSLVEKMMTQQGATLGKADSMWSFLAGGNFTVDAATKAQAQADIAEDGYWGVEQTSDRILDFAKALSNNDPSKADELLDAFDKGFRQATGSWGKDLPDISSRTYDAVHEKFQQWKDGTEAAQEAQTLA